MKPPGGAVGIPDTQPDSQSSRQLLPLHVRRPCTEADKHSPGLAGTFFPAATFCPSPSACSNPGLLHNLVGNALHLSVCMRLGASLPQHNEKLRGRPWCP